MVCEDIENASDDGKNTLGFDDNEEKSKRERIK